MAGFCVSLTKLLPIIYSGCMINNHSFKEQSTLIMDSFNKFKKDIKQTDDVTVIGLNFK